MKSDYHPVVIPITEDLVEQLTLTSNNEEKYCYIHNDSERRRVIWIFDRPITDLVGKNIEISLETKYGRARLTLPEYAGRKHLLVRMTSVADPDLITHSIETILDVAPRNDAVGRRPLAKETQIIKASVPTEIAEIFRKLGGGNVSEGVRMAGAMLAKKTKK